MKNNIRLRIKELRCELNLTQSEFADKIDIKQSNLSHMESKGDKISIDVIDKIISNFNVNAEWLFTGQGEMLKTEKKEDNYFSFDEKLELMEKNIKLSDALIEEREKLKIKEYIIDELLKTLKENNIPVKITEIEKRANRSYGESQQGAARNVG